ncbi:MAG TPA: hypothetical protein VF366_07915 [Dehalococcoidia bacterium]
MDASIKINKVYPLLLFLLGLGLLSACSSSASINPPQEQLNPPDRVDILYFYDSDICHCQGVIGDNINATLFVNYNGELTSGKLTYQSLDLADNKNTTIAHKYGATPESLFINIVRANNEHFIAVPEIKLVKDYDEALDRLVKNRVQQALDGEK